MRGADNTRGKRRWPRSKFDSLEPCSNLISLMKPSSPTSSLFSLFFLFFLFQIATIINIWAAGTRTGSPDTSRVYCQLERLKGKVLACWGVFSPQTPPTQPPRTHLLRLLCGFSPDFPGQTFKGRKGECTYQYHNYLKTIKTQISFILLLYFSVVMPPQQPLCFSLLHHGQSLPSPGVESLGEDGEEKSGCPEEKNNAISEKWCSASQRVGTRLEMGGNRCRMGTLVRSYLWITTYTCLHRSSYPFTLSSVVCMSVQTSGWGQTGIVFIPDTSGIVNTIDSLWPLKKFIDFLIPADLSADSIQLRNRDRSWRNLAYSDHSEL